MVTEVLIPKVSETADTVALGRWLVLEGERVRRGQDLFEVESDKALVVIESPAEGVLQRIIVPAGNEASVGTVVGIIVREDGAGGV